MPPECRMTLEARREDNDTTTALLVRLQDLKIGDQALEVKNSVKQLKRAIQKAVHDLAMKEIFKKFSYWNFYEQTSLRHTTIKNIYVHEIAPCSVDPYFIQRGNVEGLLINLLALKPAQEEETTLQNWGWPVHIFLFLCCDKGKALWRNWMFQIDGLHNHHVSYPDPEICPSKLVIFDITIMQTLELGLTTK